MNDTAKKDSFDRFFKFDNDVGSEFNAELYRDLLFARYIKFMDDISNYFSIGPKSKWNSLMRFKGSNIPNALKLVFSCSVIQLEMYIQNPVDDNLSIKKKFIKKCPIENHIKIIDEGDRKENFIKLKFAKRDNRIVYVPFKVSKKEEKEINYELELRSIFFVYKSGDVLQLIRVNGLLSKILKKFWNDKAIMKELSTTVYYERTRVFNTKKMNQFCRTFQTFVAFLVFVNKNSRANFVGVPVEVLLHHIIPCFNELEVLLLMNSNISEVVRSKENLRKENFRRNLRQMIRIENSTTIIRRVEKRVFKVKSKVRSKYNRKIKYPSKHGYPKKKHFTSKKQFGRRRR